MDINNTILQFVFCLSRFNKSFTRDLHSYLSI